MNCKDCRFAVIVDESDVGFCRRFPPVFMPGIGIRNVTISLEDGWCGELAVDTETGMALTAEAWKWKDFQPVITNLVSCSEHCPAFCFDQKINYCERFSEELSRAPFGDRLPECIKRYPHQVNP